MHQLVPQVLGSAILGGAGWQSAPPPHDVRTERAGGEVLVSWRWLSPNASVLRAALAADGAVTAVSAEGELEAVVSAELSDPQIALMTLGPVDRAPVFLADAHGRRAGLRWVRTGEFRVLLWWDNGSGVAPDTSTAAPLAEVEEDTADFQAYLFGAATVRGTHTIRILARDEAGNRGAVRVRTVFMAPRPLPVSGPYGYWDADEEEVVLTWSLPTDARRAAVRIYSSFHAPTGEVWDGIIYERRLVELGASATSASVPHKAGVENEYVVRCVDADGVECDGAQVVAVLAAGPTNGARLTVPAAVAATALPAGSIRVDWRQAVAGNEDLTGWAVFAAEGTDAFDLEGTPLETVSAAGDWNASPEPDEHVGLSVTVGPFGDGETWRFVVVALATGAQSAASEEASATADATAPGAVANPVAFAG